VPRVAPEVPSRPAACGPGADAGGGVLVVRLEGPDALALDWIGPSGCLAASLVAAWTRSDPARAARAALDSLVEALSAAAPPPPPPPAAAAGAPPRPGTVARVEGDPAAAARAEARAALADVEPRLAAAVRARLHLRYRKDASGEGEHIDGPHFVRDVYLDAFGVDLGADIEKLLAIGPAIDFSKAAPERALRPGDLLFFTSYAGLPRSVMIYLGEGKIAQSARVRGVVVDDVPKSVPNYLYLVAVRPPR
jgi:cell wall-associated NlpC family hydrolase